MAARELLHTMLEHSSLAMVSSLTRDKARALMDPTRGHRDTERLHYIPNSRLVCSASNHVTAPLNIFDASNLNIVM